MTSETKSPRKTRRKTTERVASVVAEKDVLPAFVLVVTNEDDQKTSLYASMADNPSKDKPASLGLLYGLALLALDRRGVVQATIDAILEARVMSEADAVEAIHLLLKSDSDDIAEQ